MKVEYCDNSKLGYSSKCSVAILTRYASEDESTVDLEEVKNAKEELQNELKLKCISDDSDGINLSIHQHLDYIFKLNVENSMPTIELPDKNNLLHCLFQNIAESIVTHFNDEAYKEKALNALVRCAYLYNPKDQDQISYSGRGLDLSIQKDQDSRRQSSCQIKKTDKVAAASRRNLKDMIRDLFR